MHCRSRARFWVGMQSTFLATGGAQDVHFACSSFTCSAVTEMGANSPDGLFAQQEEEPTRGRPAVRGKGTYGGRPGQRVEEQGTWASRTRKRSEAGYGWPADGGVRTAKTVKRPPQQPAQPQYANYWALLTRKRHTMPPPAQPQHTNHWAPRTRTCTVQMSGCARSNRACTARV